MQGTTKKIVIGGILLLSITGFARAEELQPDPAWQQGMLANGFKWQVLSTPQRPSDQTQVRLLINTGSLVENPQQAGYTHFMPRLMLGGKPLPYATNWQHSTMSSSVPAPIIVSYDFTQFALSVPAQRPEPLYKALSWLAHSVGQLDVTPARINSTLQSSDKVSTWPADTKDPWWRYRLKDSALLGHDPAEIVKQPIDLPTLKAFYRQWYTPDAMTLIVVGHVDSRKLSEQIGRIFGDLKGKRDTPTPLPTLAVLKPQAVSIMSEKVTRDRLSVMWDMLWQAIRDVASLERYWRADLAREALFWHIQQALAKKAVADVNLGFECQVFFLRAQCGMTFESDQARLTANSEMISEALAKLRDNGLSDEEFAALIAQKKRELQTLFAAYAHTTTPVLAAQRLRALQNQVVDIAPERYQILRQQFLSSVSRVTLNRELRTQLSQPAALILLQPHGEPEMNMKEFQSRWDSKMAPETSAPAAAVDEKGEVADIASPQ